MKSRFAVIIAAIQLLQGSVLLHASEGNVWAERRRRQTPVQMAFASPRPDATAALSGLAVARTLGTASMPSGDKRRALPPLLKAIAPSQARLREMVSPKTTGEAAPRFVAIIQDVHDNLEAQQNIAGALAALGDQSAREGGRLVVGVEAAFDQLDFAPFRPTRGNAASEMARLFLRAKRISAASYAGLTGETKSAVFSGIDDAAAYRRNVAAYLAAVSARPTAQRRLSVYSERMRSEREEMNPRLRRFVELRRSHKAGQMPMGPYIEALVGLMSQIDIPLDGDLSDFYAAYALEKRLDFARVERERRRVLERLSGRLTESEIRHLLEHSLAFRAGDMGYADFYRHLETLLSRHGVSLDGEAAFRDYVRYVLLSDRIDGGRLMTSLRMAERRLAQRLAFTAPEVEAVRRDDAELLAARLLGFSLTPEEGDEWQALRSQLPPALLARFAPFEAFYREADIRSATMARRMDDLLSGGRSTGVVVVGGYHTPLLSRELSRRGIAHAVYQPGLTRLDGFDGTAYLSIFSREKASLDRLFSDERLFLAYFGHVAGSPTAVETNRRLRAAIAAKAAGEGASVPGARVSGERVTFEDGATVQAPVLDVGAADPVAEVARVRELSVGAGAWSGWVARFGAVGLYKMAARVLGVALLFAAGLPADPASIMWGAQVAAALILLWAPFVLYAVGVAPFAELAYTLRDYREFAAVAERDGDAAGASRLATRFFARHRVSEGADRSFLLRQLARLRMASWRAAPYGVVALAVTQVFVHAVLNISAALRGGAYLSIDDYLVKPNEVNVRERFGFILERYGTPSKAEWDQLADLWRAHLRWINDYRWTHPLAESFETLLYNHMVGRGTFSEMLAQAARNMKVYAPQFDHFRHGRVRSDYDRILNSEEYKGRTREQILGGAEYLRAFHAFAPAFETFFEMSQAMDDYVRYVIRCQEWGLSEESPEAFLAARQRTQSIGYTSEWRAAFIPAVLRRYPDLEKRRVALGLTQDEFLDAFVSLFSADSLERGVESFREGMFRWHRDYHASIREPFGDRLGFLPFGPSTGALSQHALSFEDLVELVSVYTAVSEGVVAFRGAEHAGRADMSVRLFMELQAKVGRNPQAILAAVAAQTEYGRFVREVAAPGKEPTGQAIAAALATEEGAARLLADTLTVSTVNLLTLSPLPEMERVFSRAMAIMVRETPYGLRTRFVEAVDREVDRIITERASKGEMAKDPGSLDGVISRLRQSLDFLSRAEVRGDLSSAQRHAFLLEMVKTIPMKSVYGADIRHVLFEALMPTVRGGDADLIAVMYPGLPSGLPAQIQRAMGSNSDANSRDAVLNHAVEANDPTWAFQVIEANAHDRAFLESTARNKEFSAEMRLYALAFLLYRHGRVLTEADRVDIIMPLVPVASALLRQRFQNDSGVYFDRLLSDPISQNALMRIDSMAALLWQVGRYGIATENVAVIAGRIAQGTVDHAYENCNAGYKYGVQSLIQKGRSMTWYLGVVVHENMHNILQYQYQYPTHAVGMVSQSIHELLCDTSALDFLSEMGRVIDGGGVAAQQKFIDSDSAYQAQGRWQDGAFEEEHQGGRAQLREIMESARVAGKPLDFRKLFNAFVPSLNKDSTSGVRRIAAEAVARYNGKPIPTSSDTSIDDATEGKDTKLVWILSWYDLRRLFSVMLAVAGFGVFGAGSASAAVPTVPIAMSAQAAQLAASPSLWGLGGAGEMALVLVAALIVVAVLRVVIRRVARARTVDPAGELRAVLAAAAPEGRLDRAAALRALRTFLLSRPDVVPVDRLGLREGLGRVAVELERAPVPADDDGVIALFAAVRVAIEEGLRPPTPADLEGGRVEIHVPGAQARTRDGALAVAQRVARSDADKIHLVAVDDALLEGLRAAPVPGNVRFISRTDAQAFSAEAVAREAGLPDVTAIRRLVVRFAHDASVPEAVRLALTDLEEKHGAVVLLMILDSVPFVMPSRMIQTIIDTQRLVAVNA